MTNFARIICDVAVDVSADPQNHFHPDMVAQFVQVPDQVKVMWRKVDGVWTAPEPEPAAVMPLPDQDLRITRLAFIERFTMEEWIAIDTAAATVPTMKYFVNKVNAARYIDLARIEVKNGVNLLAENGLITQARAAEILESPIRAVERLDGAGI